MALAKKIDHVAIAVEDVDGALKTFTDNFGFPVARTDELPALRIRFALLTVGDAALELFQPTDAQSPAAKFLSERGEGMYLLSLEVDDLQAAAAALAERGIKVNLQTIPGGRQLGFVSPKQTHGVMLQFIQNPKD